MADMEASINEFISVTGIDKERAKFFIQSANGELHVALETFYDNVDSMETEALGGASHEVTENESSSSSSKLLSSSKKEVTKSKFATISNMKEENDSSDDDGQAFYVGGSETSGQQVLGPNKKKKNVTKSLFDAAKTHGAEEVTKSETSSRSSKSKNQNLFKGAGFKLGSEVEPSMQVNPNLSLSDTPHEINDIAIKFWKNGFSVGEGPLRGFEDPLNKPFLDSIRNGEVPEELRNHVHNGEVHVNMEDHGEEEFVQPKIAPKPFLGAGNVLGSPVPKITQNEAPVAIISTEPDFKTFQVDNSKPVTTIQIRLSDGTRLISKFNHDNTVGDIRRLIVKARPKIQGHFNLMTTFPSKILSDDNQTIENAKLFNAVVVQKYT